MSLCSQDSLLQSSVLIWNTLSWDSKACATAAGSLSHFFLTFRRYLELKYYSMNDAATYSRYRDYAYSWLYKQQSAQHVEYVLYNISREGALMSLLVQELRL